MRFREELDDELVKAAMAASGKNLEETVREALNLVVQQEKARRKAAPPKRTLKWFSALSFFRASGRRITRH